MRRQKIKTITRGLTIRFTVYLAIMLVVLILGLFFFNVGIQDLNKDSFVINIAGRQRMLSQKISKTALLVSNPNSTEEIVEHIVEMEKAILLWEETQKNLRFGGGEYNLPQKNSVLVESLYKKINPAHQLILFSAQNIIENWKNFPEFFPAIATQDVSIILQNEVIFLEGMDEIVFVYDRESSVRLERLKMIGYLIFTVLLAILFFISFFVIRPSFKKINKGFKELYYLKLSMDNIKEYVIVTGKEGTILYANKAVEIITGFKISETIGQKAGSKKLWGGQMPKKFYQNLWKKIKIDKETFKGQIKNKRKNGEIYYALVTISPILDDKNDILFFAAIEHDVTEDVNLEQTKDEFMSLASHQLRTPLSVINWNLELLLYKDTGKLNKKQQEFVNQIDEGAKRLGKIAHNLLNVSDLKLGKLSFVKEKINLDILIDNIVKGYGKIIEEKNLKIEKKYKKKETEIKGDKKVLDNVIQILLENAIIYNIQNGKISIDIEIKKGKTLIKVSDTGLGIPMKEQKNIFNKFYRASNAKEKEKNGIGLGLYMSKLILEEYGGSIWFESKKDKGTTFFVSLPNN
jgi:PAS domain S-box-containing protein